MIFRKFPGNEIIININGINANFRIKTKLEYKRIKKLQYRSKELPIILHNLKPNDIYWDIGANIGTHTIFPSKILKDGKALAIEPYPDNVQSLKENLKINDIGNAEVVRCVLGKTTGNSRLNVKGGRAGSGGHSIVPDNPGESITIPRRTGDDLLNDYEPPDIVKIDVEGAEYSVLQGMEEVIEHSTRLILCEIHNQFGVQDREIQEYLSNFGFDTEILYHNGSESQLMAQRTM